MGAHYEVYASLYSLHVNSLIYVGRTLEPSMSPLAFGSCHAESVVRPYARSNLLAAFAANKLGRSYKLGVVPHGQTALLLRVVEGAATTGKTY